MSELLTFNNELMMSSHEIATLCDKRHDHVCRDIENLNLEYGKLSLPKVGECDYTADNGQTYREFRLTKEQTIDLITGYRADLRIRINRRWQQLEQGKTKLLPQTKLEALKAYVAEIEAHELTKTHLTHEKELAKKDNGKSIYGASIKQVNQALNSTYTWQPLKKYCEENHMELEYIFPNGYGSLTVAVYPYDAWLNVYEIDLNLIFKD